MRYARMLVHRYTRTCSPQVVEHLRKRLTAHGDDRLEEKARVYTEEEQAGFLARAAELLAQVVRQGQEDTGGGGSGGELANDAAAYIQRVESLAKNKRTRHAP
jgi:hypothetical protein